VFKHEETKAWQHSRDRCIKEGDCNTSYFHAIANQRRRKNNLAILDGPDGPVEYTPGMIKIATNFCKNPFAKEVRPNISTGDHFWDHEDLFTFKENMSLEKPFSEGGNKVCCV
jgi:hypothetical protein